MAIITSNLPKVVIVINSMSRSGAEKQALMLVSSLSTSYKVTLVTVFSLTHSDSILFTRMGVESHCIKAGNGAISIFVAAIRLRRILLTCLPCTIHSWLYKSNLISSIATLGLPANKYRLFTSERNMPFWVHFRHRIINSWIFRRSHGVIFNAISSRRAWSALTFYPEQLHVVHNGIDFPIHKQSNTYKNTPDLKITNCSRKFVIGCVGRFSPIKQQINVVKAAAILRATHPNLQWHLVGDGPQLSACQSLIQELNLSDIVFAFGRVEDASTHYQQMDLLLQVSASEGMPNVVMEAMSWGIPVIATDVGDTFVLLDNGRCGLLIPPNDINAICTAVISLVSNPTKRKQFSLAALARIRTFDRSTMVSAFVGIYNKSWSI